MKGFFVDSLLEQLDFVEKGKRDGEGWKKVAVVVGVVVVVAGDVALVVAEMLVVVVVALGTAVVIAAEVYQLNYIFFPLSKSWPTFFLYLLT